MTSRDCTDLQQLWFPTGNPKEYPQTCHAHGLDCVSAARAKCHESSHLPSPPVPPPPKKNPHCVLEVMQPAMSELLLQNVSFIWSEWKREGRHRIRNLICYFPGPRAREASPAWEAAARGPPWARSGALPCWRPSHWRSAWSAGSLAGPDTSPAPPGSRWPVSGRPPLRRDRERGAQFSSASRGSRRVQRGPSCRTPPCSDARCPHMGAAPSYCRAGRSAGGAAGRGTARALQLGVSVRRPGRARHARQSQLLRGGADRETTMRLADGAAGRSPSPWGWRRGWCVRLGVRPAGSGWSSARAPGRPARDARLRARPAGRASLRAKAPGAAGCAATTFPVFLLNSAGGGRSAPSPRLSGNTPPHAPSAPRGRAPPQLATKGPAAAAARPGRRRPAPPPRRCIPPAQPGAARSEAQRERRGRGRLRGCGGSARGERRKTRRGAPAGLRGTWRARAAAHLPRAAPELLPRAAPAGSPRKPQPHRVPPLAAAAWAVVAGDPPGCANEGI